jgi:flagellar biosynthesis/type III secretory pathway M-ring protein FliF/YscJ
LAASLASVPEVPLEGDDDLTFMNEHVGEVGPSGSFLVGHEIEPDELKFNEISGQVSEMVKADPETAATLLKQWLTEDE